jgi:hypothetical protein
MLCPPSGEMVSLNARFQRAAISKSWREKGGRENGEIANQLSECRYGAVCYQKYCPQASENYSQRDKQNHEEI